MQTLITLNVHQYENVWIKASTTVLGMAEDIAQVLGDDRRRHMWDMHTHHAQNRHDGSIAVSYAKLDDNGINQTSLEVLRQTFAETFIDGRTT